MSERKNTPWSARACRKSYFHSGHSLSFWRFLSLVFVTTIIYGILLQLWWLSGGVRNPASSSAQALSWDHFAKDYSERYHKEPPIGLKSWLTFAQSSGCTITAYYDAIYEDLKQYQDLILPLNGSEAIDKAMQLILLGGTFQIKNGRLKAIKWHGGSMVLSVRRRTSQWLFKPLMTDFPNFPHPFVWNFHDGPINGTFPIFSSCQYSDWNDIAAAAHNQTFGSTTASNTTTRNIRMPYPNFSSLNIPFLPRVHTAPGKPFEERKNKIVWRGSTTGPWGDGSRFRLVKKYGQNSSSKVALDVGFTGIVQDYENTFNSSVYRIVGRLSYPQLQKYKYILDLDGNSFTERFPKVLLLGSIVFKQTQYREWHTERIQPYVDYIPIATSLDDLEEKVQQYANFDHVRKGHCTVISPTSRSTMLHVPSHDRIWPAL